MEHNMIDKRIEFLKNYRHLEYDKLFRLEMAESIWLQVKGVSIPECYSEEDRLSIFERYYHRASAQSQGE